MAVLLLTAVVCWAVTELPSESTLPGKRPIPRNLAAELPSEETLPGRPLANTLTVDPRLPSESKLPAGFVMEQPKLAAELLVDVESTLEPLQAVESPSDRPVQTGQAGQANAAAAPIGQAPAGLPWLRLNMQGHVGLVRAMAFTADGSRLCSAGDDKTVEVWTQLGAENNRRWVHERALRWPVERGPRGRILALATSPKLLALAGYGTLGGVGEIWLIDPASGELKRALIDEQIGHRQIVAGLSFPPGRADLLASQDVQGRLLIWRQAADTGIWTARQLVPPHSEVLRPEDARLLESIPRSAPIVMPNERQVIYASLLSRDRWLPERSGVSAVPTWSLAVLDIESGESTLLESSTQHLKSVMGIAISNDGLRLVSSDLYGRLLFWDVASKSLAASYQLDVSLGALAWSPDGQTLIGGSYLSEKRGGKALLQRWRVATLTDPQLVAEEPLTRDVLAVAMNPRGTEWAYSQGSDVIIRRLAAAEEAPNILRGLTRPVLRVAFAANGPEYRIAIGTRRLENGQVPWERDFDLQEVKLDSAPLRNEDWIANATWKGTWSLRSSGDATRGIYWLYLGEEPVAELPLHPTRDGRPTATSWIADANGRPFAVAVGTSVQGNIFVFRLAKGVKGETATILRQFRGHEGSVRSISVSRDRRYLCSGSDDGTVRIWNLTGFDDAAEDLVNRWGARFEIRDGKLVATEVREDGRFYFHGVRAEDTVRSLAWLEPQNGKRIVKVSDRPDEMLKLLRTASWDTQVVFDCRRREMEVPGFQMLPAWQPLAALYVADNREWAVWTPAGYYDASFDGHKLFGWQINRGVDLLPEFFLAAQFRQTLERPAVIQRLLAAGSLPAALRAAPQQPPGDGQDAVVPQYRSKPRIEILTPRPDEQLATHRVTIRAKVTTREGLELVPPKAFANGVVAPARQLLQVQDVPGGQEFLFEWNAAVPADSRVVIQVVASTDAEVTEYQSVQVRNASAAQPTSRRVYVLAAGVNDYQDAQIQRLDFAANNARRVTEVLGRGAAFGDATTLLNDQATRPMWSLITTDYAERLRHEAGPDDLLVLFLSGHGVRDEQTDRYYFVSANAHFDDLKAGRFADCLSFADFAAFADVPCRKLVVLDTCHSGSVQQPLRQQDLKAALRALQDDVVFTMTASEGSQEAAEEQSRQLGRFTYRLLEALSGAADDARNGGDANGLVTLREASGYVRSTVAADSAGDPQQQFPTAGPIDLLEFAEFPLSLKESP